MFIVSFIAFVVSLVCTALSGVICAATTPYTYNPAIIESRSASLIFLTLVLLSLELPTFAARLRKERIRAGAEPEGRFLTLLSVAFEIAALIAGWYNLIVFHNAVLPVFVDVGAALAYVNAALQICPFIAYARAA